MKIVVMTKKCYYSKLHILNYLNSILEKNDIRGAIHYTEDLIVEWDRDIAYR